MLVLQIVNLFYFYNFFILKSFNRRLFIATDVNGPHTYVIPIFFPQSYRPFNNYLLQMPPTTYTHVFLYEYYTNFSIDKM